ncbi:hypothetical protein E1B28_000377 [Marasmius oreades]|uniref:Uncharacterized protein n=1 Tax=Marasmius oreades TaxID=181124 RepID=A0A9P7V154_9AGAR|nr:uncharacterized protein E1B28_000377 [Marasmius oreades]KAG7098425.1 hypothetical protein E1B28_000377 [Marasmius oreades]
MDGNRTNVFPSSLAPVTTTSLRRLHIKGNLETEVFPLLSHLRLPSLISLEISGSSTADSQHDLPILMQTQATYITISGLRPSLPPENSRVNFLPHLPPPQVDHD